MSAIIVNGQTQFGGMCNAAITELIRSIADLHRVQQASAAAQSGGSGSTALEGSGSNFGVATGKGADFAFALQNLDTNLQTFLTANQGFITALDNGG